ncbi:hypothetical protein [Sphingobacterium chungjuense]|uniref:hypothetical protein n=1 Tax=Sphingobacterium chungjuense TaxID=2675553 RepID=UPI00140CB262|nr:hypothetical protein [Sphingobacterium chungjuense]
MPTIIDFNKAVIEFYLQKKADNDLNELESISPAKLKDLLLSKLVSGELQKDIPSLEKIFNTAKKFENLTRAITNESIDKFRPIQYFIQGRTTIPTDDTIILLSIFIDFQPRPYTVWKEMGVDEGEIVISDDDGDKEADKELETDEDPPTTIGSNKTEMPPTENPDTPSPVRVNWNLKDKKSLSIMASALVITLLMAFYSWPHKQCMYWDGEKYIAIHCDEVDPQLDIIALNSEKQQQFKRITRKDTLTKDHVNKVWYSKIDTEVEFFTCPGLHPVHPHRSLKAATEYIIEKYAMGKVNNEKGAVD